ncbi:hypothetical protein Nepgr_013485 [Nepenthes gracilis]|uniref:Uncharacterized protein n=1 Tax=Nepenthes gracilis TaxID=150966 RepID=A0AAD3SJA5_NEPGR|nr:hypothetical protein Nepgr_013485 [Nepenthes gracilis]
MEFRPTGRKLVAPHSRVVQCSPKRKKPKVLQLGAQGDSSGVSSPNPFAVCQPDRGSTHGELSVGLVDPVSQDDCAAEAKPQYEAFWEADEHLKSIQFLIIYPDHDATSPDFVVDDQKTSIGNQELQTSVVAGVHKRSLIQQDFFCLFLVHRQVWLRVDQLAPECPDNHAVAAKSQNMAIRHANVQLNSFNSFTRCLDPFNDVVYPGKRMEDQVDVQQPEELLMDPITAKSYANHLDALGISNCHEEAVGPPAICSSYLVAPNDHQGADPRPYTNIEQLRRNIVEMRKHHAAPGAQVIGDSHNPHTSGRGTSFEGFGLKSIPKKPQRPKKMGSPSSIHHV